MPQNSFFFSLQPLKTSQISSQTPHVAAVPRRFLHHPPEALPRPSAHPMAQGIQPQKEGKRTDLDTISPKKQPNFFVPPSCPGFSPQDLAASSPKHRGAIRSPFWNCCTPKSYKIVPFVALSPGKCRQGQTCWECPFPGTAASEFHRSWGLTPRAAPKGRFPRLGGFFWCFFFSRFPRIFPNYFAIFVRALVCF